RRVALRREEVDEPSPHLARTADDQDAASVTFAFGRDPLPLLARQRRVYQRPKDALRQLRVQRQGLLLFAGRLQYDFFAFEISPPPPGHALLPAGLAGDALALGNQLTQEPIH